MCVCLSAWLSNFKVTRLKNVICPAYNHCAMKYECEHNPGPLSKRTVNGGTHKNREPWGVFTIHVHLVENAKKLLFPFYMASPCVEAWQKNRIPPTHTYRILRNKRTRLINAPPIVWGSWVWPLATKMAITSLIIVRFSNRNHRWKAQNLSYPSIKSNIALRTHRCVYYAEYSRSRVPCGAKLILV